jgi:hypothetical protein
MAGEPSARTAYVHTMVDTHHANNPGWFVDAVDDAIVAATGDVIPGCFTLVRRMRGCVPGVRIASREARSSGG